MSCQISNICKILSTGNHGNIYAPETQEMHGINLNLKGLVSDDKAV